MAGIGVGGVALALAAQLTVENLFGGVSLSADRPVRLGDVITYRGHSAAVETIGARSSRLRGLDGTLTTVPNPDLAKMHVTNFSNRTKCFLHHIRGLRYETLGGQFAWLLEGLRTRLSAHPMVEDSPGFPRGRIIAFGSSSIDVDVRAYPTTASSWRSRRS